MGLINSTARFGRARQGILFSMMLAVAMVLAACGGGGGSGSGSGSGSGGTLRIAYQVIPNGDPIVKHEKWLEDNLKGVKIEWHQFDAEVGS